jgi:RND superfamily putative drug exporter
MRMGVVRVDRVVGAAAHHR